MGNYGKSPDSEQDRLAKRRSEEFIAWLDTANSEDLEALITAIPEDQQGREILTRLYDLVNERMPQELAIAEDLVRKEAPKLFMRLVQGKTYSA